jgi:hypothetical protein
VRNAIIHNNNTARGAWITLSIGDITEPANRLGVYPVPAGQTMIIPLDVVIEGANGDDIRAKQDVDMSTITGLSVNRISAAAIADTTVTTTYASTEWQTLDNTPYIMTILNSVGYPLAANLPGNIIDNHAGMTWSLIQTAIATGGYPYNLMRLSQYRGQSTAASLSPTTITFPENQSSAIMEIAEIVGGDPTQSDGSAALVAAGVYTAYNQSSITFTGPILGASFVSFAISRTTTFISSTHNELSDTNVAGGGPQALETAYSFVSGGSYSSTPQNYSASIELAGVVGLSDNVSPAVVTLNGVITS